MIVANLRSGTRPLVAVVAGFVFRMAVRVSEGGVPWLGRRGHRMDAWFTFLAFPGLAMLCALLAPATLR